MVATSIQKPTQIACVSGTVFVAANSVDPRIVLELFEGEWIPEICGEELDLSVWGDGVDEAVRRRGNDEPPAALLAFDEALMGEGELERPEDPGPLLESAEMPANEEESDLLI